jgi:hypothetical protein
MMIFRRALLAASLLPASLPAAAHHGWGAYDAANPVTITGRIERVTFENPHGVVWLRAEGRTLEVVLAPPFRMVNRGLRPEQLKLGETVTILGYPHRTTPNEVRAEWIRVGEQVTQLR